MKKMKSLVAAVLSFALVITMLSGCTSNGNTDQETTEPTEVVTAEPVTTEEPTIEPTTEEPTTEPSTTVETVEDDSADEIIPLYNVMLEDQVKQVSPELWFTDFDETVLPFYQLYTTDTTVADCAAFQLTDLAVEPIESVTLRGPEGTDYTTNVAIYIFEAYDITSFCFETEDGTQHIESLVPFFYNEAKGCLVGYTRPDSDPDNIRFVEVYWSQLGGPRMYDVDPSEYGF